MKKFESILLFSFLLFLSCFLTTSAAADSPMYVCIIQTQGSIFTRPQAMSVIHLVVLVGEKRESVG